MLEANLTKRKTMEKAIITPEQAAGLLGTTRFCVLAFIRDGILPCYKTPGGHRKIKRADVMAIKKSKN